MSDRGGSLIQAGGMVLAALIGAAGAIFAAKVGVLPEAFAPPPTVITVTADPPPPSDSPPPGEASPTATPVQTVFLDSLEPIEDELESESVSWQGETFSHSLINPLSSCSAVGPVIWEIPNNVSAFKAEIGVDTSSNERLAMVTFNVYLDDASVASETLAVGKHQPLDLSLGEATTIKLESIIDENRRLSCSADAIAVWGDARFE